MIFAGVYERSIDSKQRLAFPAELRGRMQRSGGTDPTAGPEAGPSAGVDGMYVSLGEERRLCLYTVEGFERRMAQLEESDMDIQDLLAYEKVLLQLSHLVAFDGTGRLRLPDTLLQLSTLGSNPSDVVLVGAHDHLQLYTATQWQEQLGDLLKRIDETPSILMNPRRAMRMKKAQSKAE